MLKLEEVTAGTSLDGVEPSSVVTVVAAIPIPPGSLQLVYRLPDGVLRERLLSRADEATLAVATASRPWSFDGDGAAFQLTAEARAAIEAAAGEAPPTKEQLDLFGGKP